MLWENIHLWNWDYLWNLCCGISSSPNPFLWLHLWAMLQQAEMVYRKMRVGFYMSPAPVQWSTFICQALHLFDQSKTSLSGILSTVYVSQELKNKKVHDILYVAITKAKLNTVYCDKKYYLYQPLLTETINFLFHGWNTAINIFFSTAFWEQYSIINGAQNIIYLQQIISTCTKVKRKI